VTGGKRSLYWSDHAQRGQTLLIDEGEFNALAIASVADDLVSPVAIASKSNAKLDKVWYGVLLGAPQILIRLDDDAQKQMGIMLAMSKKCRVVQMPLGIKDPNQMLTECGYGELRHWVEDVVSKGIVF
jgi:hypothetical protein